MNPDDATKRKFGNAGVSHSADMKCLHALAAQALAGAPNPIGCAVLLYIIHLHECVNKGLSSKEADDFSRFFVFLQTLTNEVLTTNADKLRGMGICEAAASMIIALEGHQPRARKKHRKN